MGEQEKPASLYFSPVSMDSVVDGKLYLVATRTQYGTMYMTGKWSEEVNMFVAPMVDEDNLLVFRGQPFLSTVELGN